MRLLVAALAWFALPASAADYAQCILDKMPGTKNGVVHQAILRECLAAHPGGFLVARKGSGRGFFGFDGRDACVKRKAVDTAFPGSAVAISAACHCAYEKPQFEGEMCAYQVAPN